MISFLYIIYGFRRVVWPLIGRVGLENLIEVFDIETLKKSKGFIPILVVWSKSNKIRTKTLTIDNYRKELLLWIMCSLERNKVYYAHNLLFDFSFILPVLLENSIKFTWVCVDHRLYSVTIQRPGGGLVYLKCSYRLLPMPLVNLGKVFKTKPKIIFPYNYLTKKN